MTSKFPRYMVLSPKGDDKFKVKFIPSDFDRNDQGFFGCYTAKNIIIDEECLQQFIDLGCDMKSWKDGKQLTLNWKHVSK